METENPLGETMEPLVTDMTGDGEIPKGIPSDGGEPFEGNMDDGEVAGSGTFPSSGSGNLGSPDACESPDSPASFPVLDSNPMTLPTVTPLPPETANMAPSPQTAPPSPEGWVDPSGDGASTSKPPVPPQGMDPMSAIRTHPMAGAPVEPPIRQGNGAGIASVACGVVALLASCVPIVGIVVTVPLAVTAIICGAVALSRGSRSAGHSKGVAGIVLGIGSWLLATFLLFVLMGALFGRLLHPMDGVTVETQDGGVLIEFPSDEIVLGEDGSFRWHGHGKADGTSLPSRDMPGMSDGRPVEDSPDGAVPDGGNPSDADDGTVAPGNPKQIPTEGVGEIGDVQKAPVEIPQDGTINPQLNLG